MNDKLCCVLNPLVVCPACQMSFCEAHWGNGDNHNLEASRMRCGSTGKFVWWINPSSWIDFRLEEIK